MLGLPERLSTPSISSCPILPWTKTAPLKVPSVMVAAQFCITSTDLELP